MEIKWEDGAADIGIHELILTLEDGSKRTATVWDFTCPYRQKCIAEDPIYAKAHPHAFEVSYCYGFSILDTFDHPHTLDDVKIWTEDYLLDMLISNYNYMLKTFSMVEKEAKWAENYKASRKHNN